MANEGNEIESTPKGYMDFVIRKEPEQYSSTGYVFRCFYADTMTPVYLAGETAEETEKVLRSCEFVKSIKWVL